MVHGLRFAGGRILNPDDGVSPIVHQYDRHPHLASAIHALWAHDQRSCPRKAPETAADRIRRLRRSLRRRVPELR